MFVWTILFIFSPILHVFYILPSTSIACKALYRSLFEVSVWKVCWSVLATLLWSTALTHINQSDVNFITVIAYNLILAMSLLLTPLVVHSLISGGITGFAANMTGMAVLSGVFNPGSLAKKESTAATTAISGGVALGGKAYSAATQSLFGSKTRKAGVKPGSEQSKERTVIRGLSKDLPNPHKKQPPSSSNAPSKSK